MMGGRERSAESSTGLTIGHIGISEEQAGLSREAIGNLTGLAHEAILHLHRVVDATAIADNGVFADDTRSDKHRGIHRRHHGTLRQA